MLLFAITTYTRPKRKAHTYILYSRHDDSGESEQKLKLL